MITDQSDGHGTGRTSVRVVVSSFEGGLLKLLISGDRVLRYRVAYVAASLSVLSYVIPVRDARPVLVRLRSLRTRARMPDCCTAARCRPIICL